jgi:hypothetical protein
VDVTQGRNLSWPTKPCSAVDGWDYDLSDGMYNTIVSEVHSPISFVFKEKFIKTQKQMFSISLVLLEMSVVRSINKKSPFHSVPVFSSSFLCVRFFLLFTNLKLKTAQNV